MSDQQPSPSAGEHQPTWLDGIVRFCLENKMVMVLFVVLVVAWGLSVAPFDWELGLLPRRPVPVDAIPDIGENQQIVFTEWMGRSPQDVEDQITYPLTVSLLGVPGVKTVRSNSMFGFSSIYVIFEDGVDFYWSRSRVLEKLNSLPAGALPEGVRPTLGPDATALGQVFWYTLEGRDPAGNPAGGWDLQELRTIQDWYVRYSLMSAGGIAEVASIGGFVREYQIDVDPDAMRHYGVTLQEVFSAVRMSNLDVGARTIELNRVEYVIRGIGFVRNLEDLRYTVVKSHDNVPVYVHNVAHVALGPAVRRGALDKEGAEAVGGVAIVRYGFNPLDAIKALKAKIAEIGPGLPEKVVVDWRRTTRAEVGEFARARGFEAMDGDEPNSDDWMTYLRATPREQWPSWVTISRVHIVPFYDRTGLIYETLGTLSDALAQEILITVIVVVVSVWHLRSSVLISGALPLAVLICFIAMKLFGVDANIVALSGIAIAIGTIVDMSIIVCENSLRHLEAAGEGAERMEVIFRSTSEVGSAVLTAVATTVVSFLPVFAMVGTEGKLFRPLAFTKTFALVASVIVALLVVPPAVHLLFAHDVRSKGMRRLLGAGLVASGLLLGLWLSWWWVAFALGVLGMWFTLSHVLPAQVQKLGPLSVNMAAVVLVTVVLTRFWEPLGPQRGFARNMVFVAALVGGLLGIFYLLRVFYAGLLRACLRHKLAFLVIPGVLVLLGMTVWLGFSRVFSFAPKIAKSLGIGATTVRTSRLWSGLAHAFPGLGKEFMPPLEEGSFLLMPTTMPHASIGEALDVLQKQDMAIRAIPEVDTVVGKVGRAETPLDPAPISMVETVVGYRSEYRTDKAGHRINYQYDDERNEYSRDADGELIPDPDGRPYRQWRDRIRSPEDIWEEVLRAASIPGTTSAPKLQPISARLVMLQSGMRAPMGIKVRGPDLVTIERVTIRMEGLLKRVPSVKASSVIADRIVGKPYLEIDIDRRAIARYGIHVKRVQDVIEMAIGGDSVTTTVEGRERYPVRVRYMRELRDTIEELGGVLVASPGGVQVPLRQLAKIRYARGPQSIKSEDTFLIGYVLFDKRDGFAEVDVVEDCRAFLSSAIESGELVLPAGVSYTFAGNYQNQVRARRTLSVVLPVALLVIFLILYFQFKSVSTTMVVFSGITVAWAGGFLLIWLYGQPWFLDFSLFGVGMRELFQVGTVNLSVAVWVGFLALFGIASDNGVVIATYLDQSFASREPRSVEMIREATVAGAVRRIRPCLMTSATTILALLPVLTSTGRGSDVMVPMAIPSFGGMLVVLVSVFAVPVLYCLIAEAKLHARNHFSMQ